MSLTGRYNFRKTMTGKLVLQVEYETRGLWSRITGKNACQRRWRNANVMDLAAPELRGLLDQRFRPRFVSPQTPDVPSPSRPLETVPARPVPYWPDGESEDRPTTH